MFHVKTVTLQTMGCPQCGGGRDRPGQSYCRECHNAYRREHRPSYGELSERDRLRARCRAYTGTLIKRGHLTRGLCEGCEGPDAQAHHEDYTKPREVAWLCRACHMARHGRSSRPPEPAGMTLADVIARHSDEPSA